MKVQSAPAEGALNLSSSKEKEETPKAQGELNWMNYDFIKTNCNFEINMI